MYNHTTENTITACGLTTSIVTAAATKLIKELHDEPFEPYTDLEKRALLMLAISGDSASVLLNALHFIDTSLYDNVDCRSKAVEMLEKYPPTVDQILKTFAMRELNELQKD